MNVTLTPDQFLMVYRSVSTNATPEAKEVKAKMESIIHHALTSFEELNLQNKFPQWLKKEQEKITNLNDELKCMKDTPSDTMKKNEPDDGLYFRKS